MQKMQEETQAVYQKYGVSPTGSCVQLSHSVAYSDGLYQVIYKIPAYVGSVKNIFTGVVDSMTAVNGYTDILQQFITDNKMTRVQLVMDRTEMLQVILSLIFCMHYLLPSGKSLHRWISFQDFLIR